MCWRQQHCSGLMPVMEGGPPAKRRRRCINRSDFLEDEEWSAPDQSTLIKGRSTPVRQLDGSSSRFKFDSKSDEDSNGIKVATPYFCFATFSTEND